MLTKPLWFKVGDPGTRLRSVKPQCVVLHHTAGEGAPDQVFRTLQKRRLSVHYVIGKYGEIVQYADPGGVICSHAGFMNTPSIGIEICSRGVAPSMPGYPREAYTFNFRGKDRQFLKFYQPQLDSVAFLVNELCWKFSIPRQWPADQMVMPREALLAYRGILGHHHITQTKVDPSPHLWEELGRLLF